MRVCHIVPGYYPFNPGPYEYTRHLANLNVDADVIAFGRREEAGYEVVDGVSVRRVPLERSQRFSPRSARRFIFAALRWCAGRQYDLIHVYAFRGCGLLPVLGRDLTSRWILDIRTGNTSLNLWRSGLADWMTRLESLAYDTCIALDRRVGERVLGRNRFFHVVPLGVDFERFRPGRNLALRDQLQIKEDSLVVVFSGKLEPRRLPERVLQGFARAVAENSDLVLVVVGDGGMLPALRSLAKGLGVVNKVRFTGYIPYKYVHKYITVGDVGLAYVPIVPQYDLQPPLKTVEFLACGLPTVATWTRGNALFIREGENGLLVQDTPEAIAGGLLQLVEDRALCQKLALNARPSVAEYDWKKIVRDKLLPVYRQLVEG